MTIRGEEARRRGGEQAADDDRPPIGRSWRQLYAAVLINLAVLIAIFYAFTKVFE